MTKKKAKAPVKSQAERLLEAAKKTAVTENSFQRSMGKLTLARQARKSSRMG
jgi:hypothetical protein